MQSGRVIVITGAMASGKSTVAQLVAERLPRSVHLRGDGFRTMIVNGGVEMTEDASGEALAQLELRYDLAAQAADRYATAGFDVVLQDVIIGPALAGFLPRIRTLRRYLVVLIPTVSALEGRKAGRLEVGYTGFTPGALDDVLRRHTPRTGYWLDSTGQSPSETADQLLAQLDRAAI